MDFQSFTITIVGIFSLGLPWFVILIYDYYITNSGQYKKDLKDFNNANAKHIDLNKRLENANKHLFKKDNYRPEPYEAIDEEMEKSLEGCSTNLQKDEEYRKKFKGIGDLGTQGLARILSIQPLQRVSRYRKAFKQIKHRFNLLNEAEKHLENFDIYQENARDLHPQKLSEIVNCLNDCHKLEAELKKEKQLTVSGLDKLTEDIKTANNKLLVAKKSLETSDHDNWEIVAKAHKLKEDTQTKLNTMSTELNKIIELRECVQNKLRNISQLYNEFKQELEDYISQGYANVSNIKIKLDKLEPQIVSVQQLQMSPEEYKKTIKNCESIHSTIMQYYTEFNNRRELYYSALNTIKIGLNMKETLENWFGEFSNYEFDITKAYIQQAQNHLNEAIQLITSQNENDLENAQTQADFAKQELESAQNQFNQSYNLIDILETYPEVYFLEHIYDDITLYWKDLLTPHKCYVNEVDLKLRSIKDSMEPKPKETELKELYEHFVIIFNNLNHIFYELIKTLRKTISEDLSDLQQFLSQWNAESWLWLRDDTHEIKQYLKNIQHSVDTPISIENKIEIERDLIDELYNCRGTCYKYQKFKDKVNQLNRNMERFYKLHTQPENSKLNSQLTHDTFTEIEDYREQARLANDFSIADKFIDEAIEDFNFLLNM